MNNERQFSSIPFFRDRTHGDFSVTEIEAMDDITFSGYAFSWRGRKRITENLQKLEEESQKS